MAVQAIRFDLRERADGGIEIVPVVDGVPLTALIDAFELGAAMHPAGDAYGGLVAASYRFGPLHALFHGRATDVVGEKPPLLGCECGEWGCWPLLARVTVTAGEVRWDAFEQPFRPDRDYRAFGPFRFDPGAYDGALRNLDALLEP